MWDEIVYRLVIIHHRSTSWLYENYKRKSETYYPLDLPHTHDKVGHFTMKMGKQKKNATSHILLSSLSLLYKAFHNPDTTIIREKWNLLSSTFASHSWQGGGLYNENCITKGKCNPSYTLPSISLLYKTFQTTQHNHIVMEYLLGRNAYKKFA